jgi:hypothetical protein
MDEMVEAFCDACVDGELEAVRRLLAEGVSPGSVRSDGEPALCLAAEFGSAAVVELLLGVGTGVNVPGSKGTTPLMTAAYYGKLDIARLLVLGGADPALKNKYGEDALAIAEMRNHAGVAALLRDLPVERFATVTGADAATARRFLQQAGGNLQRALDSFFTAQAAAPLPLEGEPPEPEPEPEPLPAIPPSPMVGRTLASSSFHAVCCLLSAVCCLMHVACTLSHVCGSQPWVQPWCRP